MDSLLTFGNHLKFKEKCWQMKSQFLDSKRVIRELRNPCSKYWKGRPCSKSFNAGSHFKWFLVNFQENSFQQQIKFYVTNESEWTLWSRYPNEIGRLWSGRSYKECQPHGINLKRYSAATLIVATAKGAYRQMPTTMYTYGTSIS